jgi:hypothetical protein
LPAPFIIKVRRRELQMPIESALVTVFVLVVFTGFAVVLAWAERRSQ